MSAHATEDNTVILIAYDGSADAQAAIDTAGQLMKGQPATVLTVWERLTDVVARTGAGVPIGEVDYESVDESSEDQAHQRARKVPSARARRPGATGAHQRSRGLDRGHDPGPGRRGGGNAIVMGTPGLTGIKSLLLGSVSHGVIQHADRPVVVVPSPATASERAAHRP